VTEFEGRQVAVWGAARSGVAAANLLADLGASVLLSDRKAAHELNLETLDSRVAFKGQGNHLDGAEILIPSPGIPPHNPDLVAAQASGVLVMGEIALAASVARAPIVAITGTDGKTTTTEMIGHLFRQAGRPVVVAGNIGDPLSNRVRDVDADGVIIAEVSAFQLWSCPRFAPRVAVVTNIAGDHADYFEGDTAAYIAAKARVLRDMERGGTAILRGDDPVVSRFETPAGVSRVLFGPTANPRGWGVAQGHLCALGSPIMAVEEMPIPGDHNVANALSAMAAGDALGLEHAEMARALRLFEGLPHRLQRIRVRGGVAWFDDSKATNPHAAAAGLRALGQPKVVITGGYDKGLDLSPFVDALEGVRHVILTGHTADRTAAAMGEGWPTSRAGSMDEAVKQAAQLAQPGDAVVLSPGASSFDAYRSYAHRGQVFQSLVSALD